MLSKKDYLDYLKQIKKVEEDMRETYRACLDKVKDDKILKICQKLMEDETRHAHMVEDLEKLVEKQ